MEEEPDVTQPYTCSQLSQGIVEAVLFVKVTEELLKTGFQPVQCSGIDQSAQKSEM